MNSPPMIHDAQSRTYASVVTALSASFTNEQFSESKLAKFDGLTVKQYTFTTSHNDRLQYVIARASNGPPPAAHDLYIVFPSRGIPKLLKKGLNRFSFSDISGYADGNVHSGFLSTVEALPVDWFVDIVKRHYDESFSHEFGSDRRIIFGGHSIGGSIALLVALKVTCLLSEYEDGKAAADRLRVIQIGSPHVGNRQFALFVKSVLGDHHKNYVRSDDPVPCASMWLSLYENKQLEGSGKAKSENITSERLSKVWKILMRTAIQCVEDRQQNLKPESGMSWFRRLFSRETEDDNTIGSSDIQMCAELISLYYDQQVDTQNNFNEIFSSMQIFPGVVPGTGNHVHYPTAFEYTWKTKATTALDAIRGEARNHCIDHYLPCVGLQFDNHTKGGSHAVYPALTEYFPRDIDWVFEKCIVETRGSPQSSSQAEITLCIRGRNLSTIDGLMLGPHEFRLLSDYSSANECFFRKQFIHGSPNWISSSMTFPVHATLHSHLQTHGESPPLTVWMSHDQCRLIERNTNLVNIRWEKIRNLPASQLILMATFEYIFCKPDDEIRDQIQQMELLNCESVNEANRKFVKQLKENKVDALLKDLMPVISFPTMDVSSHFRCDSDAKKNSEQTTENHNSQQVSPSTPTSTIADTSSEAGDNENLPELFNNSNAGAYLNIRTKQGPEGTQSISLTFLTLVESRREYLEALANNTNRAERQWTLQALASVSNVVYGVVKQLGNPQLFNVKLPMWITALILLAHVGAFIGSLFLGPGAVIAFPAIEIFMAYLAARIGIGLISYYGVTSFIQYLYRRSDVARYDEGVRRNMLISRRILQITKDQQPNDSVFDQEHFLIERSKEVGINFSKFYPRLLERSGRDADKFPELDGKLSFLESNSRKTFLMFLHQTYIMHSLRTRLRNVYNVAVVGPSRMGKSLFMQRIGDTCASPSTLRMSLNMKVFIPEKAPFLRFMDFPGYNVGTTKVDGQECHFQEMFASMSGLFDAAIVVCDSTTVLTEAVKPYVDGLCEMQIPVCVIVNKGDMMCEVDSNNLVSRDNFTKKLNEFANQLSTSKFPMVPRIPTELNYMNDSQRVNSRRIYWGCIRGVIMDEIIQEEPDFAERYRNAQQRRFKDRGIWRTREIMNDWFPLAFSLIRYGADQRQDEAIDNWIRDIQ